MQADYYSAVGERTFFSINKKYVKCRIKGKLIEVKLGRDKEENTRSATSKKVHQSFFV